MTREAFLQAYRSALLDRYDWAHDAPNLDRFMASCEEVLAGNRDTRGWDYQHDACKAAWKAIGGKGRVTLKALRALPDDV
jgi:hypothetical protein